MKTIKVNISVEVASYGESIIVNYEDKNYPYAVVTYQNKTDENTYEIRLTHSSALQGDQESIIQRAITLNSRDPNVGAGADLLDIAKLVAGQVRNSQESRREEALNELASL